MISDSVPSVMCEQLLTIYVCASSQHLRLSLIKLVSFDKMISVSISTPKISIYTDKKMKLKTASERCYENT